MVGFLIVTVKKLNNMIQDPEIQMADVLICIVEHTH